MSEGTEQPEETKGRPSRAKIWWSAVVVAVLLAAGGVVVALVIPEEERPAEYSIHTIEGFPEYQKGTHVVAADSRELPSKTLGFSFVPTRTDLHVVARCDLEPAKFVRMDISINGRTSKSAGCDEDRLREPVPTDEYGLVVGKEVHVTADLSGYGLPASHGTFGVAFTEPVPQERYPYPPRPENLVDLRYESSLSPVHVRSGGPAEATFAWKQSVVFYPRLNTPGKLQVLLDGKPADECESWDYQVRLCPTTKVDELSQWRRMPRAAGQQVKVTVVAERTTGDWEVGVEVY